MVSFVNISNVLVLVNIHECQMEILPSSMSTSQKRGKNILGDIASDPLHSVSPGILQVTQHEDVCLPETMNLRIRAWDVVFEKPFDGLAMKNKFNQRTEI